MTYTLRFLVRFLASPFTLTALLLTTFWACSVSAAPAPTAAVFPVEATNLETGEAAALGTVFALQYEDTAQTTVLRPEQTVAALKETGDYVQAAQSLGVAQYIRIDAVRLESRIMVHATLYDARGARLHGAELEASTVDDLAPVSQRLAQALVDRGDPRKNRTIHTVTRQEARPKNRVFTDKVFGVKTSVVMPFARGFDFEPMVLAQFDMRLESDWYFLEFGAGAMVPTGDVGGESADGYGGLFLEMGGSVYFTEGTIAPYAGLGVSPRLTFGLGDENVVGFSPYGQVGVMFMRDSSSRVFLDLRASQEVIGYRAEDADGDKRTARPTEIGLNFGIGW